MDLLIEPVKLLIEPVGLVSELVGLRGILDLDRALTLGTELPLLSFQLLVVLGVVSAGFFASAFSLSKERASSSILSSSCWIPNFSRSSIKNDSISAEI